MFHSYCVVSLKKEVREKYIENFIKEHKVHAVDVTRLEMPSIGISDIRRLIFALSRAPFASSHKIAVIDGEALTNEAQQALLKTLEEPPVRTVIILFTSQIDALLPTIVSRTLVKQPVDDTTNVNKQDISQDEEFWKTVLTSTIGVRLGMTADLTKDRQKLITWTETQIAVTRQRLLAFYLHADTPTSITGPINRQILDGLQKTYSLVSGNISLKLAVDHMLINLPYVNYPVKES